MGEVLELSDNLSIQPIKTDIPLSPEQNIYNDCGPISIQMLLMADKDPSKVSSVEQLRQMCGKDGLEGTMPGNMCQTLQKLGYGVEYFTTIDWSQYTEDMGDDYQYLPPKAQKFKDFFKSGFINGQKLQDSAKWLEANKQICVPQELNWTQVSNFLNQGKRLIAIVGGDHYLVITGLDENYVYFNNPDTFVTLSTGGRVEQGNRKQRLPLDQFEEWVKRNMDSTELIVATPQVNLDVSEGETRAVKDIRSGIKDSLEDAYSDAA